MEDRYAIRLIPLQIPLALHEKPPQPNLLRGNFRTDDFDRQEHEAGDPGISRAVDEIKRLPIEFSQSL